jgi:small-conductance mechanosensitive channel/CRP-like cAMP-binding protein
MPTPDRPHLSARAAALVAAAAALALPRAALADDAAALSFASPIAAAAICAMVVVVAYLVNRFAPGQRRHVRRTAIVLLVYLAAAGASLALAASGIGGAVALGPAITSVASLLGVLTLINVAGIVTFDLALPSIGVRLPALVTDVAVGLAYAIAVMQELGVQPSSILATSAVATAVLALSLQTTLGNVLGGVALQLDDSIRPGDWIQLENGRQGKVREIRWRHTVLETRDWDTIIVPNASLLAANIMILGKRLGQPVVHRMTVPFHVDFRYGPTEVIAAVEGALRAGPIDGAASSPEPVCQCLDFSRDGRDSFAYYGARYWLADLDQDDRVSSLVRTRVYSALKRAGIPLAIPAAQLFVEHDGPERRGRKAHEEAERRERVLLGVELLRPLRAEERAAVAQRLTYAPFVAGEIVTRQGAIDPWLYIVTRGRARVCVSAQGAEREVATIEAPGFFGEMALMTGEPRRATVVAATDLECYRLDKQAFDAILAGRPEIARDISELLARRGVELQAAREHLDAAARERQIDAEKSRLLERIRGFFGLADRER